MSPAKPVTTRIRGPLEKEGIGKKAKEAKKAGAKAAKPRDFTVARDAGARAAPFANAVYAVSAHLAHEMPAPGVPEIAFAGRSNAGKSSAINALAGRRRLAFVSKTPGRTQLVNFFSLGGARYLVDLPGYGYAGVPDAVRDHWKDLVGTYIAERSSLAGVVVMMDVRHPLTTLDRTLLAWLREAGRPAHVLLTKADKLSRQAASVALMRVRRELAAITPGTTVQLFSSLKSQGLEEAAAAIDRLSGAQKQSPA